MQLDVLEGLTHTKVGPLQLTGYTDSDYAADLGTRTPRSRRSVTVLMVFASGQPIIRTSARQPSATHSSTEAEYIAADTGTRTMTWPANPADELKLPLTAKAELRIDNKADTRYHEGSIISGTKSDLHLLEDNKGAFDIAHAHGPSKRTEHLDDRYH